MTGNNEHSPSLETSNGCGGDEVKEVETFNVHWDPKIPRKGLGMYHLFCCISQQR